MSTRPKPRTSIPRDAFLTIEEVAKELGVSVRTIERMDLPTLYLTGHTKRYNWGQVHDALLARATA
jgi:DeoR/GlpR family transcriptional regulator of sugar metabolism